MKRLAVGPIFAFSIWVVAGFGVGLGCSAPKPHLVVTDPDPSIKIPAIAVAVDRHDLSVAPQLIKDLESDDGAVRMYAIEGLRKLTGERFGYLYYADEETRRPAVLKWRRWLAEHPQGKATTRPGTSAP